MSPQGIGGGKQLETAASFFLDTTRLEPVALQLPSYKFDLSIENTTRLSPVVVCLRA